jgi:hypothetical protein
MQALNYAQATNTSPEHFIVVRTKRKRKKEKREKDTRPGDS